MIVIISSYHLYREWHTTWHVLDAGSSLSNDIETAATYRFVFTLLWLADWRGDGKLSIFCAELRWNFFVCQLKSWMMEIAFHATTTRRLSHYINAMLKFIESKMNLDTFGCVRHCCHADINVRPSK